MVKHFSRSPGALNHAGHLQFDEDELTPASPQRLPSTSHRSIKNTCMETTSVRSLPCCHQAHYLYLFAGCQLVLTCRNNCLDTTMSSTPANHRFANVAFKVIDEQIRPLRDTRSPALIALQPRSIQEFVRTWMTESPKDPIRVSFDLTMSILLLAISAIHIYHGALIFHGVVVTASVQPGRTCASSSFLMKPSAIGIVDPNFCYKLRLQEPVLSCSSIGSDAKVNALFDIPNKLFLVGNDCATAQNSNSSDQCRALFASSLFSHSDGSQSQSSPIVHLSQFCSSSMAHMGTSASDTTIEVTSITSLKPSFLLPSSVFPFCSCDAAWTIVSVDGRGGGATSTTKFLLQEPPRDTSDVKVLEGAEAAAVNCHKIDMGSTCVMPTAVRTPFGLGCACLQWIHFKSQLWWILLLLQMIAAATVWLREGTALLLPAMAYRNVHSVNSMKSSLPCAIATAVWRTHLSEQASIAASGQHGSDFRRYWLQHFQTFTLAQHLPMFIGSYLFARLVSMSDDTSLQIPSSNLAALAAVAGWGLR